MTKKPPALGCVNPAGTAILFDRKGRAVAATYDTPNSVQVAFEMHPKAVRVSGEFRNGPRRKFTGRCLAADQREACKRYVRTL